MTTLIDMHANAIAALQAVLRWLPAMPTAGTRLQVQCGDTLEGRYLERDAVSSGTLWAEARRIYDGAIDCQSCSESAVFVAQADLWDEWEYQVDHARRVIERAIEATRDGEYHRAIKLQESLDHSWGEYLDTESRRTFDDWCDMIQPAEEALLACRDHEPRGAQVVGL